MINKAKIKCIDWVVADNVTNTVHAPEWLKGIRSDYHNPQSKVYKNKEHAKAAIKAYADRDNHALQNYPEFTL